MNGIVGLFYSHLEAGISEEDVFILILILALISISVIKYIIRKPSPFLLFSLLLPSRYQLPFSLSPYPISPVAPLPFSSLPVPPLFFSFLLFIPTSFPVSR